MDYKEKYEQALERCKKEFNFNNLAYSHEEIKQILEHVFPELKEDERIRKALIQHIKYKVSVISGWRKEELIAWLEKQGEQKPVEWSEDDERMCQETIDWFEKKCFPYALESQNPARESIKWLKSLKDRIQPQSNIEKLKNEINKRIKKLEPVHPHFAPFVTGQRSAFKDCLNFIDSLQSETDKR